MVVILGLAVGLIVGGLLICWLSGQARPPLNWVFYWVGIVLAMVGLVLLLAPVILWLSVQLRAMLAT